MDIKIVDDKGLEIPKETKTFTQEGSLSLPDDQALRAIQQSFDLDDSQAYTYKHKIDSLLEYVKSQTKDLSPENIKWIIRDLELKIGTPPFTENRVSYIARYAYLLSEKRKIDSELKGFDKQYNL